MFKLILEKFLKILEKEWMKALIKGVVEVMGTSWSKMSFTVSMIEHCFAFHTPNVRVACLLTMAKRHEVTDNY